MTAAETDTRGECEPRFESVHRAFARNFAEHGDVGAAVAVPLDGSLVVDLWAGTADRARARPWERDTIACVYSATKGLTAICAHMLADRGSLDLEAPVTKYWPEFARSGKEELPVRYLLTHQAGLPVVTKKLPPDANLDWDTMVRALAEHAPLWPPGERHGAHASTFGWLVGEVIRRVSGRSVGTFLREEVAEPLGIDLLLGFGPEEDSRVADTLQPTRGQCDAGRPPPPDRGGPVERIRNSRACRAAEIPSGNGHGNARALAAVYGALARGGEIGGRAPADESGRRERGARGGHRARCGLRGVDAPVPRLRASRAGAGRRERGEVVRSPGCRGVTRVRRSRRETGLWLCHEPYVGRRARESGPTSRAPRPRCP